MNRTPTPATDDGLTDEQRITALAELLVIGAIAAVGLSGGGRDRGSERGACDGSKSPPKPRSR